MAKWGHILVCTHYQTTEAVKYFFLKESIPDLGNMDRGISTDQK